MRHEFYFFFALSVRNKSPKISSSILSLCSLSSRSESPKIELHNHTLDILQNILARSSVGHDVLAGAREGADVAHGETSQLGQEGAKSHCTTHSPKLPRRISDNSGWFESVATPSKVPHQVGKTRRNAEIKGMKTRE